MATLNIGERPGLIDSDEESNVPEVGARVYGSRDYKLS